MSAEGTPSARVLSIQAGPPREHDAGEAVADGHARRWRTGFFKESVAGPIHLLRDNLEGDGQADLRVHGGPDKAVLVYSADHHAAWRAELGVPEVPPAAFGENFTVSGVTEALTCIGDVWTLSEARVQVSQPRGPCWKLARRWGREDLPARVLATGRTGWYLRVLEEGMVEPGPFVLRERPWPEWTIARVNEVAYAKGAARDRGAERRLAACPLLAEGWRAWLERRARGGADEVD